jgi:hypothetical protein
MLYRFDAGFQLEYFIAQGVALHELQKTAAVGTPGIGVK